LRNSCVAVAFAVLCSWLATGNARSQTAPATLVVEVSNGTARGATVLGDVVTLQLRQHEQLVKSLEAEVGQAGEALFEDLPTAAHMVAVVRVKHQNMAFQGRPVVLAPGQSAYSTSVQVFDVSSDVSELSVGTHHIMVGIRSTWLEFTEYMQLRNGSDMAIRGAARDAENRPVVIEIALPKGFRELTSSGYLVPSALVTTATGFYDTLAVPPGEHQVSFSYRVDIDRGTMDIAKEISLPTSEVVVFWENGQGDLQGLGEPDDRLTNAEGVAVEYYRRTDQEVGDRIAFQISGFNVTTSDTHTWIVLIVAFSAVVVVAIVRLIPKSRPVPPAD